MNRKERRAAGKGASPGPSPQLALAIQHHQRGALREAEQLYGQVLAADPKNATALQLLGVLTLQAGQPARAVELIGRSIAIDSRNAQSHYNIALAYAALKQWDNVETHSRRAAAFNPDNIEALLNLGNALHAQGKNEEAIRTYRAALARQPDRAELHGNLANVLAAAGKRADAIAHYQRALALNPNHPEGHNNLGTLLLAEGRAEDALVHHQRAVALNPGMADAYLNLGNALQKLDRPDDATAAYRRALDIQPALPQALGNLAGLLTLRRDYDAALPLFVKAIAANPDSADNYRGAVRAVSASADNPAALAPFNDILIHAIERDYDGSFYLIAATIKVLRNTPEVAAYLNDLPQLPETEWKALARNRLLRTALARFVLRDIEFERLLTQVRDQTLVEALAGEAPGDDELAFACALASQCFPGEYFYDAAAKRAELASLRAEVAALVAAGSQPLAYKLAALAAFEPLASLSNVQTLLTHQWPAPVEALLNLQVREPQEEAKLRASMPRFTSIDDAVSLAVREQYEANPYPRWTLADVGKDLAPSFDDFMRAEFPSANIRPLGKQTNIDYLIAGCGTGAHVMQAAHIAPGLNITAIDLSLASLGFAKRSTQARGLTNVTFGQADILKLADLGKTFDVIDSVGVLHHMADPEAGWRVLVSLLRPGGFMRIALYSTLARRNIAAARKFVAERGFSGSAEDIRRARQEILALPDTDPVRKVSEIGDFFSLSDCRDLIFHVQESTFDLPRIGRFLDSNGLAFIGFNLPPATLAEFDAAFPEPGSRNDLARWDTFEHRHPDTFIQMYQFWLHKTA